MEAGCDGLMLNELKEGVDANGKVPANQSARGPEHLSALRTEYASVVCVHDLLCESHVNGVLFNVAEQATRGGTFLSDASWQLRY
jgi:hypothetical protein